MSEANSDPRDDTAPNAFVSWETTTEYDTHGNVTRQVHDGPDVDVATRATWAGDGDLALWRPTAMWTESTAAGGLVNPIQTVEKAELWYDGLPAGQVGAGELSRQSVCAATPVTSGDGLCDERLEWTFTRTPRGAVALADGPEHRDVTYGDYRYGGVIPTTETNALGHVTTRWFDDLGNVTGEADANGVTKTTFFDPFGRPVSTFEESADGTVTQLTEVVYHDLEGGPAIVETQHLLYDAEGVEEGSHSTYAVSDGFGRALQQWRPSPAGGWVATEEERDASGVVRRVSEPHLEAAPAVSAGLLRGPNREVAFADVFGEVVHAWSLQSGDTATDHPTALETRVRLADDSIRVEARDPLGRLSRVDQGRGSGALTTVGTYAWDGRDRVLPYADGGGNAWLYQYDGAGRVR